MTSKPEVSYEELCDECYEEKACWMVFRGEETDFQSQRVPLVRMLCNPCDIARRYGK